MIADFVSRSEASKHTEYDYVLVGAGAVGLYLASLLVERGKSVCVLESGGMTHTVEAKQLNRTIISGRHHAGAVDGRARVVGGTTSLWGGQLTEFSRRDLHAPETQSFLSPRWLYSYEEITGLYRKCLADFGLRASLPSSGAPQHAVDETRAASLEDNELEVFHTRWLREPNFARRYQSIFNRKDADLYFGAHARSLACDGPRVSGVVIAGAAGDEIVCARNFVLCNGTLEISRLLLLAASRNESVPWLKNPNIGLYFQDHLDLVVGRIKSSDARKIDGVFSNTLVSGEKLQPKLRWSDRAAVDGLNAAISVRFNSRFGEDLAAIKHMAKQVLNRNLVSIDWRLLSRVVGSIKVWMPLVLAYVATRRIKSLSDLGVDLIAHCEQSALRESRILLSENERDRFGDPLLELTWRIDEEAQTACVARIARAAKEYFRLNHGIDVNLLKDIGQATSLSRARDSNHHCGGACMGDSAASSVVNKGLYLHGCENLQVVGAAVFPTSSFANPTFTALALAKAVAEQVQ